MATIHICDRCKQQKPKSDLTVMSLSYKVDLGTEFDTLGEVCSACKDAIKRFARGEWKCPESHMRVGDPEKGQTLFFPLRTPSSRKCRWCPNRVDGLNVQAGRELCEACRDRANEDRVNSPG